MEISVRRSGHPSNLVSRGTLEKSIALMSNDAPVGLNVPVDFNTATAGHECLRAVRVGGQHRLQRRVAPTQGLYRGNDVGVVDELGALVFGVDTV